MIDAPEAGDLGRYLEVDGRPAVRFERTYAHSIERVWGAVSDPAELPHWFPSSLRYEARPGGEVTFSGDPHAADVGGRVIAYQPPHRFAFTWGDDEVHLDLDSLSADSCRLTLTNILSERAAAARNGAGWSVCLAELDKVIAGRSADGPHGDSALDWNPFYQAYLAAGLPSGAELPAS